MIPTLRASRPRTERRPCATFALALAGLIALAALPVRASRIDGVAAAIGGGRGETAEVILRSDVELRARMLLLGRDRARALHAELPRGLLAAALRELIGERLIAREAERVQVTRPTAAQVLREKTALLLASGGAQAVDALLDQLGAEPAELDELAQRRALVGAFLAANLEGSTLITDREVEQQIARDPASKPDADPERIRAQVRAALARGALARNIERWVRVLRARVPIRIYPDFESL